MKKILVPITALIAVILLISSLYLYDSQKTFPLDWSSRLYIQLYGDQLRELAQTFQSDEEIRMLAYGEEGGMLVKREHNGPVVKASAAQISRYLPLYQKWLPQRLAPDWISKTSEGVVVWTVGYGGDFRYQLDVTLVYSPKTRKDLPACEDSILEQEIAYCGVEINSDWDLQYLSVRYCPQESSMDECGAFLEQSLQNN